MPFREIATAIVVRGGKVIPLLENSKQPNSKLVPNGAREATDDPLQIAIWNQAEPNGNVGWVATPDTFFFIDEDVEGSVPAELFKDCLTQTTGSGKKHYILRHSDKTRAWGNHSEKVLTEEIDEHGRRKSQELFSIRCNYQYVAGPGCKHPDTGKTYFISNDVEAGPPNEGQLEWLGKYADKSATVNNLPTATERKLHKRFTMEAFLKHYDIQYKKDGNKYHVHFLEQGCPVAGRVHHVDGSTKPREVEQCSFIWDEGGPPGFVCLSGGCCGQGFKDARSALIKARPDKKVFQVWEKEEEFSLKVLRGSEEKPLRQLYMWDPFLPLGQLVHVMGMSGEGKSPLTVDLIARVTAGKRWPDGAENKMGPRSVISLNLEDHYHTVILPRFNLASGDGEKFYYIKATEVSNHAKRYELNVALDRDWGLVQDLAREIGDVALIVVDPITNYLGKKRMNNEEEVREVLTPMAMFAQSTAATVMTVGHLNKREPGTNPMQRGMGAAAFIGVSREAYFCGSDPDNEDKHAHVMAPTRIKSNPGIKYSTYVKSVDLPDSEGNVAPINVVGIKWGNRTKTSAEELANPESNQSKGKVAEAATALRGILAKGKLPIKTCINEMKNLGHDLQELNSLRVRKRAGVGTTNEGKNSCWFIATPEPDTSFEVIDVPEELPWGEGRE